MPASKKYLSSGVRCGALLLMASVLAVSSNGASAATSVAAAVLPVSRSVQVDQSATLFATVINAGSEVAEACTISNDPRLVGTFSFQTTDSATNSVIGTPNTAVDIPVGGAQSFVLSLSSSQPMAPTALEFRFGCANATPAGIITGVNTLLFSASSEPVPDLIALGSTTTADGIVVLPDAVSANAFSVATINVGSTGEMWASAESSHDDLPVQVAICQTDPLTSACLASPSFAPVPFSANAASTATFGVFVNSERSVDFNPASNRVYVRFRDTDETVRGATSIALRMRDARDPLPLTSANGPELANTFLEDLGLLQRLLQDNLSTLGSFRESLDIEDSCYDANTFERHSLQDNDGSLTISSGDVLVTSYGLCSSSGSLSGQLQGDLRLQLDRVVRSSTGSGAFLEGRFVTSPSLTNADGTIEYAADISFKYVLNGSQPLLLLGLAAGGPHSSFSLTRAGATNSYQAIDLARNRAASYNSYDVKIGFALVSDALRGQTSCSSTALIGQRGYSETSAEGILTCASTDGSAMRVQTALDLIEYDAASAGTFEAETSEYVWERSENSLLLSQPSSIYFPTHQRFEAPIEGLISTTLAVTDFAVSELTDRIYVVNPAGLLVISPLTGMVEQTVTLAHTGTTLAVTDDGSKLYVGFSNPGLVQGINLLTLEVVEEFTLGVTADTEAYAPVLMQPLPDSLNQLVIAKTPRGNGYSSPALSLYTDGVEAANSIEQFDTIASLAFIDSSLMYTATGNALYAYQLDAEGITKAPEEWRAGLTSYRTGGVRSLDGILYGGRGVVFDVRKQQVKGRFNSLDTYGGYDAVAYDPAAGRAYRLDDSRITVFDSTTFAPLGQVSLQDNQYSVHNLRQIELLGERLVVGFESSLFIVGTNGLPVSSGSNCQTLSLTEAGLVSSANYMTCGVTAVVYHTASDRFIMAMPSSIGAEGNSLMFLVPQTGLIERVVPVGSEPNSLSLSADGTHLFVTFEASNTLARVNLVDYSVTTVATLVETRDNTDYNGATVRNLSAIFPGSVAASPFDNDEAMLPVNLPNPLLYRNGGLFETPSDSYRSANQVFYSETTPGKAFGASSSDLIFYFDVSEIGVTTTATVDNLLEGNRVVFDDNYFYSDGRQKIDPQTLVVTQEYVAPDDQYSSYPRGVAVSDGQVLFLREDYSQTQRWSLSAYDEATGDYLGERYVPQLGGFFEDAYQGGFQINVESDDWLVLSGPAGVLVIPKPELIFP